MQNDRLTESGQSNEQCIERDDECGGKEKDEGKEGGEAEGDIEKGKAHHKDASRCPHREKTNRRFRRRSWLLAFAALIAVVCVAAALGATVWRGQPSGREDDEYGVFQCPVEAPLSLSPVPPPSFPTNGCADIATVGRWGPGRLVASPHTPDIDVLILSATSALSRGETDAYWAEHTLLDISQCARGGETGFGAAASMSDDGLAMVVGEPGGTNACGSRTGMAYVFVREAVSAPWTLREALTPNVAALDTRCGASVALSGDGRTVALGCPGDASEGACHSGSVHVFTHYDDGVHWTRGPILRASEGKECARQLALGASVALSSDGATLVAGAPVSGGPGSALLFERCPSGWERGQVPSAELIPGEAGGEEDRCGASVGMSSDGSVVAVGCPGDESGGVGGSGAVFVRGEGTAWPSDSAVAARLVATDAREGSAFGAAVAVSRDGRTIAVGAPGGPTSGGVIGTGRVYVYEMGETWAGIQRDTARLRADGLPSRLGVSVALSADGARLAAGAWGPGHGGRDAGAVYVFSRSQGWAQSSADVRLITPTAAPGARLGETGALCMSALGTSLVAGTSASGGAESVFVADFSCDAGAWEQGPNVVRIDAADGATGDLFGSAVTVAGDVVVVGAEGALPGTRFGGRVGAVYVFEKEGNSWEEIARLVSGAEGRQSFGSAVAVTRNGEEGVVAVGEAVEGLVHVFAKIAGEWAKQEVLQAPDSFSVYSVLSRYMGVTCSHTRDLGSSVAAFGSTVVAGAIWEVCGGVGTSAVTLPDGNYPIAVVFERGQSGWNIIDVLLPSGVSSAPLSSPEGVEIGVAASDGVAAVATKVEVGDGGFDFAVYVFERQTGGVWVEKGPVSRDWGPVGADFAFDVSVEGSVLVVGTHSEETRTSSAVVFERTAAHLWEQTTVLVASDGAPGDLFGVSVGVSGELVVVGAPGHSAITGADDMCGAAYVFRGQDGTWEEITSLEAPNAAQLDRFGTAVSISERRVVVGARGDMPCDSANPTDRCGRPGHAYVFDLEEFEMRL